MSRPARPSTLTHDDLVSLMVGRELGQFYPATRVAPARAEPALDVEDSSPRRAGAASRSNHSGEIVGLAGLEGQGQRDIIRALVGSLLLAAASRKRSSERDPTDACRRSVVAATRAGLGFIPEDRKSRGSIRLFRSSKISGWGCCAAPPCFRLLEVDRDPV